jgi:O-antigen biosynthesis protein WbqV
MNRIRLNRPVFAAVHDGAMAAVSFVLSLWLRLGDDMAAFTRDYLVEGTVLFTVVCMAVFLSMRFYRALWRYASVKDLLSLAKGVTLTILIFLPLFFLLTRLGHYPRSAAIINWFVLLSLLGGPRFLYRIIKEGGLTKAAAPHDDRRIPVLLVGAGDAAELFIRELSRTAADADYRVVGALDDQPRLLRAEIHGVRVFGGVAEVVKVVEKLRRWGQAPQRLILTERFDGDTVRTLLDTADELGLALAQLPRLTDFKSSVDGRIEPRPIAIEDLLGRPQTVLDRDGMRAFVSGRRILVTGAGGTIGAELTRQIAAFGPAHLALFESSEFNLYSIDGELAAKHPDLARSALLGDVRDARRLETVFARERPELVFHAAAYKHVPMVEDNPNEGVLTNVVGTRNVADACRAQGVAAMVMISTDKAVNPSNVMGATKRIAEIYCQALGAAQAAGGTRFITVRFGNVLGSTGSVVPLFRRQIADGGPLTVTHADMTRYFMTVREAVELVLEASARGGGESGGIFVLEMGEPVRILDLARQMIRLAGLRPDEDIEIAFTGLRAGERLHERLFNEFETLTATGNTGVMLARSRAVDLDALLGDLDALEQAAKARDTATTLALVRRIAATQAAPAAAARARAGD